MVVIQIDGMNKDIDDGSALVHIIGGHLADIVQKGQNLRLGQRDLLIFLNSELRLQLRLFCHALVESIRQHFHGLPLLDGFPEILNGRVRLSDRLFQRLGCQVVRAFGTLLSHLLGNKPYLLLGQHFQALIDHTVLNVRLTDDLLVALFPAGILAHIVVILPAGLAGATVAHHHFLAVSAEQLCGQQVFALAVSSGRRIFVLVHHRLHPVKQVIVQNARHSTGCFLSFVKIDADITLVAEQMTEAVGAEFLAEGGLDPAPFQISDDLRFRLAAGVALINLTDNGGFLLIHIEPPLGIDLEAQAGIAAVRQALFGIDGHTPMDLLRKLHGIIFRHTFQNALHQDAGSVVRNILLGRQHPDTVLFQLRLVDGTVIAVSSKAVQLIYQNALKGVPVAVGDHPLKFGTVVRGAADGSIDILSDNGIMIRLRIFIAHLELSFNGLLRLAVAGKAGVNDYIHTESSSPILL